GLPRGTHIEVRESHDTLRLARLSGVPFTSRLVTKFDLPVVGWREHRFQKGARRLLNNQQGLKGFEPPEQGEGQQTIRR
ncbi:MAG: hypothetical protein L0K77_08700, partial [Bifidobacterium crudilactis]|nr:hypothetical protein [Bifidobacterium crudilactis]